MILTLELNTQEDYRLFISLAKRLNVKYHRTVPNLADEKEKKDKLSSFFGVLDNIDAEEMIKQINDSKTINDIDSKHQRNA